jgi:hypothetical protein
MNNLANVLNSFGLVLDIAGAYLLFRFGLPASIDREGHVHLIDASVNVEEKEKARRYDQWGQVGLGSLIIGFILQIISNFV